MYLNMMLAPATPKWSACILTPLSMSHIRICLFFVTIKDVHKALGLGLQFAFRLGLWLGLCLGLGLWLGLCLGLC